MTPPLDQTGLGQTGHDHAEIEAVLRQRLHRLADHAPTTVRAIDEIAVAGVPLRARRDRRRTAGIGGTIAILAAALGVTTLAVGSGDEGGAATPEEAVVRLVDAIEDQDVLAALDTVDPTEVGALRAAIDQAQSDATRLELLDESLRLDGVAGIDVEADGLAYATNDLTGDLATVEITAGTLTTSVDPAALPLGELGREGVDGEGSSSTSTTDLGAGDPGWATLATVRRAGRWYVSVGFTVAEAARRSAGVDLPSMERRPAEGFATAQEAATAFLSRLLDGDVAGAIATSAPGEGDALARYAPLWLDGAHEDLEAERAEGWEIALSDVVFDGGVVDGRSTLTPTSFRISGTVPADWYVGSQLEVVDGEVAVVERGGDEPIPVEVRRADGCTTFDAGAAGVVFIEARSLGMEPAADGSVQLCEPSAAWWPLGLLGGNVGSLPSVATVEVDGAWYVSPLGTITSLVTDLLRQVPSREALFRMPLAAAFYGTDHATLESFLVGRPLAEVPETCTGLVVDDGQQVTGVVTNPTVDAAKACQAALDEGDWFPFEPDVPEAAQPAPAPAPVAADDG